MSNVIFKLTQNSSHVDHGSLNTLIVNLFFLVEVYLIWARVCKLVNSWYNVLWCIFFILRFLWWRHFFHHYVSLYLELSINFCVTFSRYNSNRQIYCVNANQGTGSRGIVHQAVTSHVRGRLYKTRRKMSACRTDAEFKPFSSSLPVTKSIKDSLQNVLRCRIFQREGWHMPNCCHSRVMAHWRAQMLLA